MNPDFFTNLFRQAQEEGFARHIAPRKAEYYTCRRAGEEAAEHLLALLDEQGAALLRLCLETLDEARDMEAEALFRSGLELGREQALAGR